MSNAVVNELKKTSEPCLWLAYKTRTHQ